MSNQFNALRGLVILGICLLLAVFLGYLLATPENQDTLIAVGLVFAVLALPLVMRWHHSLLVLSWNLCAVAFFLPGQLQFWMILTVVSLAISVFQRALNQGMKFLSAVPVILPLVVLAVVVFGTAQLTGGIGFRAGGGTTYGGKRYLMVLLGILGFFALISRRIPPAKAVLYVGLFFLGGITAAIANLVTVVNPSFYFIFVLFPPDIAQFQAEGDLTRQSIGRLAGLGAAASCCFYFLMAWSGIRGLFGLRNFWRLLLAGGFLVVALYGGFRSVLISMLLVFALVFYFEGLMRTRYLPLLLVGGIAVAAAALPFVNQMPLSVQRTFSFLPIRVDAVVAADAQDSSDWRVRMWKVLLPEVPNYLWLGKGYSIRGDELELTQNLAASGQADAAEVAMLAGDYHSGPLSVIIPFGVWGAIAFVWFLLAAGWAIHRNYRYGEPGLKRLNTLLLAYFWMRVIMFFAVVGGLNYDLVAFTGLVGLSISLNGGICRPRPTIKPATVVRF